MNDYTFDYSKVSDIASLCIGDILVISRGAERVSTTRTIRRVFDLPDKEKVVDILKPAFSYGFRVTKLKKM